MKHYGPVALRSTTGGLILPLESDYDREVLFENITDRVRRDHWVDVSMRGQHWRATLITPNRSRRCSSCGEALTIAHASAGIQLCTPCRKRALH